MVDRVVPARLVILLVVSYRSLGDEGDDDAVDKRDRDKEGGGFDS
jgi:hypothetical protein